MRTQLETWIMQLVHLCVTCPVCCYGKCTFQYFINRSLDVCVALYKHAISCISLHVPSLHQLILNQYKLSILGTGKHVIHMCRLDRYYSIMCIAEDAVHMELYNLLAVVAASAKLTVSLH